VVSHSVAGIDPWLELWCNSRRASAALKASSKSSLAFTRPAPSTVIGGRLRTLDIDGTCTTGSLNNPLRGDEGWSSSEVAIFPEGLSWGDGIERGRNGEDIRTVGVGDLGDACAWVRFVFAKCHLSGDEVMTTSTAPKPDRGRMGVVGGVRGRINRGGLRLIGEIGGVLSNWVGYEARSLDAVTPER